MPHVTDMYHPMNIWPVRTFKCQRNYPSTLQLVCYYELESPQQFLQVFKVRSFGKKDLSHLKIKAFTHWFQNAYQLSAHWWYFYKLPEALFCGIMNYIAIVVRFLALTSAAVSPKSCGDVRVCMNTLFVSYYLFSYSYHCTCYCICGSCTGCLRALAYSEVISVIWFHKIEGHFRPPPWPGAPIHNPFKTPIILYDFQIIIFSLTLKRVTSKKSADGRLTEKPRSRHIRL